MSGGPSAPCPLHSPAPYTPLPHRIFLGILAFVLYQVYRGKRSDGFDHDTTMKAMAGMLKRDPGGFKSRRGGVPGNAQEVDALLAQLAASAGSGGAAGGGGTSGIPAETIQRIARGMAPGVMGQARRDPFTGGNGLDFGAGVGLD